jgi:hypothetical protein
MASQARKKAPMRLRTTLRRKMTLRNKVVSKSPIAKITMLLKEPPKGILLNQKLLKELLLKELLLKELFAEGESTDSSAKEGSFRRIERGRR